LGTPESRVLPLQTPLPEFALPDVGGKFHSPKDFADAPGLLVMFISNHCPYVTFIASQLAALTADFQSKGLAVVGINPNAATNPEDSPTKMPEEISQRGYTFPYLIDQDQAVAKAFMAYCTPEFFLFDIDRKLAYHGQFDWARPRRNVAVTGDDLKAAVDLVMDGRPAPEKQIPGGGCSIEWISGAEPAYLTG